MKEIEFSILDKNKRNPNKIKPPKGNPEYIKPPQVQNPNIRPHRQPEKRRIRKK